MRYSIAPTGQLFTLRYDTAPAFFFSPETQDQKKVLPGLEPGSKDSKSLVMTITL